jgi:glucose/arabinose dehydrogenase
VGEDNFQFGWLKRNPRFHDIPCQDITLAGVNYTTPDLLNGGANATTGAFLPFGTASESGQIIKGQLPCSGAVMRIPLEGGEPQLVAWGFRNPYGLAFDNSGNLFITDNGYDERGSRPVWGTGDFLFKVEQNAWYGWPDFSGDHEVSSRQFKVPRKGVPRQLLAKHPSEPPKPAAYFGVHSSSNGFDFSRSESFGFAGEAFVAQFGDMAPGVGKTMKPVGFKVVRADPETGVVLDFAVNRKGNAPAAKLKSGGLERPVAVRFSPDGNALYIVDFGIMLTTAEGPKPIEKTGIIWKVTRSDFP